MTKSFAMKLWCNFAYLNRYCECSGLLHRQNCLQLATLQLEGLICDSTEPIGSSETSVFEFTSCLRSEQCCYSHAQLHVTIICLASIQLLLAMSETVYF